MSNFHHHDLSNGVLSVLIAAASTVFAHYVLEIAKQTAVSLIPALIVATCIFFYNRFLKKKYPDENNRSKNS